MIKPEKEEFLRNKMYELHFFTIKLIITFASATLAFSVGSLAWLPYREAQFLCLLYASWFSVVLSIILIFSALYKGLELTYDYYNNLINEKEEINSDTNAKERKIHKFVIWSFGLVMFGIMLFITFMISNTNNFI